MVKSVDNFIFFTFSTRDYALNVVTGDLHFVNKDRTLSAPLPEHPVFVQVRTVAASCKV